MGHQSIWTGCVGALYLLALFWGYAIHRVFELPDGGPPVAVLFSYLPASLRFHDVGRDFFDILVVVGLLFQLMATWEVLSGPLARRARGALSAVAAAGVVAVWACPPSIQELGPLTLTSMELVFAGIALSLLAAGRLGLRAKHRAQPREHTPRKPWRVALRQGFARWAALEILFSGAWLFYVTNPYYVETVAPPFQNWRMTVTLLWSLFSIFGLPYAVWTARVRRRRADDFLDPGLLLLLIARNLARAVARGKPAGLGTLRNRRVRSAVLDLLVKAFFLPLMVTFLFGEAQNFMNHLLQLSQMAQEYGGGRLLQSLATLGGSAAALPPAQADFVFKTGYGVLRDSLFVVDVCVGLIGYACSFWWLHNKSKSVEPTFGGWLVALACYPPLTILTTALLPFGTYTGFTWAIFRVPEVQNALLLVALAGNFVYVWATLAFGLRFSNLTHRGIITQGPYRYVRHPAYAAKVVAWWCETVPVFGSLLQMLFFAGWVVIYTLRALTEERHLRADPCYRSYCETVRHRFVPGLW